jgi:hypothetical protein
LAKDILAALASFCTRLCRRCLLASSDIAAQASCLIRSVSYVKPSAVIGVTGVSSTLSGEDVAAILSLGLLYSVGGLGILRSTLAGLKGNSPAAAYPARMFRLVIDLSLAG